MFLDVWRPSQQIRKDNAHWIRKNIFGHNERYVIRIISRDNRVISNCARAILYNVSSRLRFRDRDKFEFRNYIIADKDSLITSADKMRRMKRRADALDSFSLLFFRFASCRLEFYQWHVYIYLYKYFFRIYFCVSWSFIFSDNYICMRTLIDILSLSLSLFRARAK